MRRWANVPYRHHHTSRRRVYWALGAAAVAAFVVVGLLVAAQRSDDADRGSSAIASDDPAQRGTPDRDQRGRDDRRRDKVGPQGREDPPSWLAGAPDLGAGIAGGPHRAVLTVTSAPGSAIGVRYAFRTGASYRDGTTSTSNGSWRAQETVRGHAPLAGVIAQVVSGSVTCTASLDGRVISTRTSSGSFATVLCAA